MRLTDNPADELSWLRVFKLLDGVGPTRARRVLEDLRARTDGPPELERWAAAAEHIPEGSREQAGAEVLVGKSTHSLDQAVAAEREAGDIPEPVYDDLPDVIDVGLAVILTVGAVQDPGEHLRAGRQAVPAGDLAAGAAPLRGGQGHAD